jgi:hypothetical protein
MNLTNCFSDTELEMIHGAAIASGICLVEGTTRIQNTHRRWRPLSDLDDAIGLMVHLHLSIKQDANWTTVYHYLAPGIELAKIEGNSPSTMCLAITTAAYNMSKRLH